MKADKPRKSRMKCEQCNQELVKIYQVGWAHKPYSNCTLDDGLTLIRVQDPNDKSYLLYEYIIKDIPVRRFFVDKFNSKERGEGNTSQISPQIEDLGSEIVISQESPKPSKPKRFKTRFKEVFEPYYE